MAEKETVQTEEPTTQPPANKPVSVVGQVKAMMSQDKVKEKFKEILGQKASQFMASVTNAVSGSTQLKKCPASSIIGAAFVAATFDLPIDPNLGFAAIVPYNESVYNPQTKRWDKVPRAQFQMMYKGFIQLAIRSGEYEKMNYAVVYQDELLGHNPITGEIKFVTDFSKCTQRSSGDKSKIVGYYAWFRLKSGYSHELYMSTLDVASMSQMNVNMSKEEGTVHEYWQRRTNSKTPIEPWKTYPIMIRYSAANHTSPQGVFSRSANRGLAGNVMSVSASGNVGNAGAWTSYVYAPLVVV